MRIVFVVCVWADHEWRFDPGVFFARLQECFETVPSDPVPGGGGDGGGVAVRMRRRDFTVKLHEDKAVSIRADDVGAAQIALWVRAEVPAAVPLAFFDTAASFDEILLDEKTTVADLVTGRSDRR
ncbi:MAG: hypothetical protein KY451_03045 [Actinobacteria bacterium]|nr:hypothetical protein [Actinomycetota bacterium]MBW3648118.1 hypothetical protein [Actinomycetota bacterium]